MVVKKKWSTTRISRCMVDMFMCCKKYLVWIPCRFLSNAVLIFFPGRFLRSTFFFQKYPHASLPAFGPACDWSIVVGSTEPCSQFHVQEAKNRWVGRLGYLFYLYPSLLFPSNPVNSKKWTNNKDINTKVLSWSLSLKSFVCNSGGKLGRRANARDMAKVRKMTVW